VVGLITLLGLVASIATSRIAGTGVAVRASLLRLLAELFKLDRRRIDVLSGVRIPPLTLPQPRAGAAPAEQQQLWVQSPMRRRLPAFGLIRLPVVTTAAAAAVAWWWGTILGLELSIRRLELGLHQVHDYYNWRLKVDVLGVALRPWTVSWVEAVIVLVGALVGLVLWPRVQRVLLSADAAFVRELAAWLEGTSTTELSREVVRLSETRAQAVTAADAERRRIERDLHDGFQPQLVNLALNLGLARSRLATDPEAASALLDRAHEDAKRATEDLRNIVRGIHPSVLDERGLDAAFSALAASSRVRLQIDVHLDRRPPREAEGIAYFVVAEAVTNVNKHTKASIATITVSEIEGSLRVLVQDDGEGGARSEPGGGLAGLADRIAAVDGTFTVTSPPGGPTWIEARIPCGS
jgi:signal transduction histidine kinase